MCVGESMLQSAHSVSPTPDLVFVSHLQVSSVTRVEPKQLRELLSIFPDPLTNTTSASRQETSAVGTLPPNASHNFKKITRQRAAAWFPARAVIRDIKTGFLRFRKPRRLCIRR